MNVLFTILLRMLMHINLKIAGIVIYYHFIKNTNVHNLEDDIR